MMIYQTKHKKTFVKETYFKDSILVEMVRAKTNDIELCIMYAKIWNTVFKHLKKVG